MLQPPQGHRTASLSGLSSPGCPLQPHKVTGQLLSQGCSLQAVLFSPTRSPDGFSLRAVLFRLSSPGTRSFRLSSPGCPLQPHKVTVQRLSQGCPLQAHEVIVQLLSQRCPLQVVLQPPQGHRTTSLSELSSPGRPLQPHKVTIQRLSQGCPLKAVLSVALPGLASQGCAYTRSPYNLHRTTSLIGLSYSGCPLQAALSRHTKSPYNFSHRAVLSRHTRSPCNLSLMAVTPGNATESILHAKKPKKNLPAVGQCCVYISTC